MSKLTKNRKLALDKLDKEKRYTIDEASGLVKEITTTKFDAAVDIDIRLGVDPKKANQMDFDRKEAPSDSAAAFAPQ